MPEAAKKIKMKVTFKVTFTDRINPKRRTIYEGLTYEEVKTMIFNECGIEWFKKTKEIDTFDHIIKIEN